MSFIFRKKSIAFALAVVMCLSLIGCSDKNSKPVASTEVSSEPLTIRLEGVDAGYPNPFTHKPRMRGTVMKYIFDSLLEVDDEGYIPWLAEKIDMSDDGKTYEIKLREDVKWHDGEDFTADDVVFSFEYYQKHPPVFIGAVMTDPEFLKVEKVDDYNVKLTTAEPDATIMSELAAARIIPEHIWSEVEDPYTFQTDESLIGTGPYQLTDYNQEQKTYRYVATENYWGPKQAVDVIEYIPVSDSVIALEKAEIDIGDVSPDVVESFKQNENFKVIESPALSGYELNFNMNKNPIFKDVKFRQAIAYAIDKDELIEKIARGGAKPGSAGFLPVDHIWYNENVKQYDYNPELAQTMLKEIAGDAELSFELLVGSGKSVRLGEVLKEQLARVGIQIEVVSLDDKAFSAKIDEGSYELGLISFGSWGLDADYLRGRFSSEVKKGEGSSSTATLGANQGYENSKVNELAEEQLRTTDENARKEIIFELQEVLAEELPEIALFNNFYYTVYQPEKYDGWKFMFDHPVMSHSKLSYLEDIK